MNEPPDGKPGTRSWFGRVARVLSGARDEPPDRAALVRALRDAERRDVVGSDALAMIEGALSVGDMQVRDIMVPRAQMVVIEDDEQPEEFVGAVVESGHSRFPVIGDNRDEVVGILFAKDLLTHFARNGGERFDLADRRCVPRSSFRRASGWTSCSGSSSPDATTWRSWWTSTAACPVS